jgi:hypothetical protein
MPCCQPFAGSAHHPFCRHNSYVAYPSIENPEFLHVEQGTTYRVYKPDVVMDWVLKNLGCIMSMNGRPLSLSDTHVVASLETASKIVTSHLNNVLTGFAILEPKKVTMANKYKAMIGEVITANKKVEVFIDAITVSVIYTVPGHGCDLMGFVRSITPPKHVIELEAVKGSEKFYKRIGMTKYGEEKKHKTHLFVCERNTFFDDVKVLYQEKRRKVEYPFFAGFSEHMLELAEKPLEVMRAITGCPTPVVPTSHKTVSVFRTVPTCKTCHMELCLCDLDPEEFGDLPMPTGTGAGAAGAGAGAGAGADDFSFAAAEAYGAALKREAEEAAKRAAEFSDLFASTASARKSVADSEAKVSEAKQRAEAARSAAAAAQKAAEEAAEAARKAEAEEKDVHVALAAAVAANAAALRSLEVAVSRKRSRE